MAVMKRADVVAGGQLVVGAFAGEQGPGAALSPAIVGAAVFPLAVAVVVVATPAGAIGGFDLEDVVDDFEGVDDERVVGAADAVADEFEEAGVDDLAGLEVVLARRGRGWRCGCMPGAAWSLWKGSPAAGGRMRM